MTPGRPQDIRPENFFLGLFSFPKQGKTLACAQGCCKRGPRGKTWSEKLRGTVWDSTKPSKPWPSNWGGEQGAPPPKRDFALCGTLKSMEKKAKNTHNKNALKNIFLGQFFALIFLIWGCNPPPACYRSLSGPSGPKCPGSVPRGVSGALRAPGSGVSKKCSQSVPRVSPECPDTFLTLRGHSGDTFWTLRSPGPEGPQRHPEGHSRDTSGPKGPRDSCSRPGGLQIWGSIWRPAESTHENKHKRTSQA